MNISPAIDRRRRRHAPELKQGLVALCQPGVSVSALALAYGVNANLLRRWIHQFCNEPSPRTVLKPARLVAVQVDSPAEAPVDDAIEVNIKKNSTRISIRWPGYQAHACGQWLGEWIK